jgi:hypothetical protein
LSPMVFPSCSAGISGSGISPASTEAAWA